MSEDGGIDTARLLAELDALMGPGPERAAAPPVVADFDLHVPPPQPRRPAPAPEPNRAAEGEAPAPAPADGRTVLVVEDDKDFRKILRYLLTQRGHRVIEAKDGAEGLKLARANHPSLALLDFDMPGLNGYELLQELRRGEETRHLPIIMITGAKNRRQLRELGMDISDFLDKPIENDSFLAAVTRALGKGGGDAPDKANGSLPAPEAPVLPSAPSPPAEAEPEAPADIELEPNGDAADEEELLIEEAKKEREEDIAGLDVLTNDSPLVNRINRIFIRAVDMGASDIHIEPEEKAIVVRLRVNGSLKPLCRLPAALGPQVAARVKIMSNLVITERRRPQDGQVRATIRGQKVEFRVSTVPAVHGEKIVLRILGGAKLKPGVADLGLNERDLLVVERALQSPHGLILVTGPTGSGKTTTLYTMIRVLNKPDTNIMTAEDPVEYELAGITQVAVKPHLGLTFEAVLRSFLRQDPDIMLVGEIRDLETAEIAVKAAITGHLVLSTLHTNSAPAAITRMAHMGVAPFLLSDSVKMIIAQRLVRTLCKKCKKEAPLPEDVKRMLTEPELAALPRVWEAPGCAACGQNGYTGRMPIFEVMEVHTPEIRQRILAAHGADEIAAQAVREGMTPLRGAALAAVGRGETSVAEALGVILAD
ncbi:response regulator [bacterium]|nr:MAG: response regulator [bacterium]